MESNLTEESQQKEFLKKLGMNLEDARPSGRQIMKALKYFDLAIKMEVTLVSNGQLIYLDLVYLESFNHFKILIIDFFH